MIGADGIRTRMAEEPIAPAAPAHPPAGIDGVAGLMARLREHKIVQWALAYVGAAITIAHGEELLAHAFAWNELYARWLLALLLVGFPIALTIAWYQGHKGLARVTQGELVIGSILLMVGGVLFVFLVRAPARHATEAAAEVQASAGTAPTSTGTQRVSTVPRLAVLPFENLSPDPKNAFFTDGLYEEILTAIANGTPGLEVISRTTMLSYRGKPVTMQTLAHELDCSYVMEGSVRREGDVVRLTLQLIDARSDRHVWAQDYDRKLVSAMALESEVAAAVASQLSQKFGGVASDPDAATDPLAYDLYLKSKAAAGSFATYHESEQLLKEALERDPKFVRAYLQRVVLRTDMFLDNHLGPDEALPAAHADLATAQQLAPGDPRVMAVAARLAFVEMDYARALTLFQQAEAAGLADPEVLDWHQTLLFAMGRYPEAVAISRRLADLDPKNEEAQAWAQYMQMEMHHFPEALRLTDLGIARGIDPDGWRESRAVVLFFAGGDFEPLRAYWADKFPSVWKTAAEVRQQIGSAADQLSRQHRFQDLRRLLDSAPAQEWNCLYIDWPVTRVGLTPVAVARGWNNLFLGDTAEARRDGQHILEFLARTPENRWNKWYRLVLRAEAQLFMGDAHAANVTAAEAVALTRTMPDVSDQMNAYVISTQIMAWSGSKEEAVRRLEDLSTSIPGLWPGEIGGNPVYSIPLASLASYKALTARLTAQMQASGLQ
jgi:TolB-like protein